MCQSLQQPGNKENKPDWQTSTQVDKQINKRVLYVICLVKIPFRQLGLDFALCFSGFDIKRVARDTWHDQRGEETIMHVWHMYVSECLWPACLSGLWSLAAVFQMVMCFTAGACNGWPPDCYAVAWVDGTSSLWVRVMLHRCVVLCVQKWLLERARAALGHYRGRAVDKGVAAREMYI